MKNGMDAQKETQKEAGAAVADPGLDHVLYRGPGIDIGLFDCPVRHPRFRDTGPARGDLLVFPRHAVHIDHGRGPVVAGRNVVMLYNHGQEYRREALSAYGDQSIWLRFDRETVVEALAAAGKAALASERRPFTAPSTPCPAATFLAQRRLTRSLLEPTGDTGFEAIPELALGLLADAVDRMPDAPRGRAEHLTERRHVRLARDCRALLETAYAEALPLETLARRLATTPYHLARVFKRHAGLTVHQYVLQLRLRAAMDRMIDTPRQRLTDLGADLGFATPSHFTSAFRRQFGLPPSAFLNTPS